MDINITWYSHACFLLEYNGSKIITDPFITGNRLATIKPSEINAEYIFVSHGHADHLGDTVEIAKHTGATVVANPEICNWLADKGVENFHPMQLGGGFNFPFGRAKMVIAHHSSPLPDGSYGGNPCGFIFSLGDKNIYHACDTGLFYDMKLIGDESIDMAFLPIGDNFTMGPDDAFKAIKLIKPDEVIPIHYNTFDVIMQDPKPWVHEVNRKTDTKATLLQPGESYTL
ncbi:MAG: metal-dependent hydrolase [bacterium]|nr:metal-dependent hydrolase [bacterium]